MWAAAAAAAAAADLAAEIAAVNAKFDAIALDARNEMKAALTALDRLAAARRRSKPSTAESRKTWRAGPGMLESRPCTVASQPGWLPSGWPLTGMEPQSLHSVL